MTERLFLDQPTLARVDATVVSSAPEGVGGVSHGIGA
jgi:hypothetical protein